MVKNADYHRYFHELDEAIVQVNENFEREKQEGYQQFDVTNNVDSGGDGIEEILVSATQGGGLVASGLLSVDDGIAHESNIQVGRFAPTLAAGTCDFTPTGTAVFSPRKLSPKPFQIHFELCPAELAGMYGNERRVSVREGEVPPTAEEFIVRQIAQSARNAVDNAIINADMGVGTGATSTFNGLVALTTDAITAAVSGQTPISVSTPVATFTSSNIVAEIDKTVQSIPTRFFTDNIQPRQVFIMMSFNTMMLYRQALGANANYVSILAAIARNTNQNQPFFNFGEVYPGFDSMLYPLNQRVSLVAVPQFPDNRLWATYAGNPWLGMQDSDTFDDVSIVSMRGTTLDKKVRFALEGTMDVNVAFLEDLLWYSA